MMCLLNNILLLLLLLLLLSIPRWSPRWSTPHRDARVADAMATFKVPKNKPLPKKAKCMRKGRCKIGLWWWSVVVVSVVMGDGGASGGRSVSGGEW